MAWLLYFIVYTYIFLSYHIESFHWYSLFHCFSLTLLVIELCESCKTSTEQAPLPSVCWTISKEIARTVYSIPSHISAPTATTIELRNDVTLATSIAAVKLESCAQSVLFANHSDISKYCTSELKVEGLILVGYNIQHHVKLRHNLQDTKAHQCAFACVPPYTEVMFIFGFLYHFFQHVSNFLDLLINVLEPQIAQTVKVLSTESLIMSWDWYHSELGCSPHSHRYGQVRGYTTRLGPHQFDSFEGNRVK